MNKKKIIVLLIMIISYIIFRYYEFDKTMNIENIVEHKDGLIYFAKQHLFGAVTIYLLTFTVLVGVGLPVSGVLTVAGGLLFGLYFGVLFGFIGQILGAIVSFLASRYVLFDYIDKKYKNKMITFKENINKNKSKYILGLRLLPGMPFCITNILAGITNIELYNFLWATGLGILPGTGILVYFGNSLRSIANLSEFKDKDMIISMTIIIFLISVGIFGRIYYDTRMSKVEKENE